MKLQKKPNRFPKQWLHWAKSAGLEPENSAKWYKHCRNPYFVGHNRVWRVNMFGVFECSCPLEYFDRWANSRGADNNSLPRSEAEFLATVASLIYRSRDVK
jgi:hypothetical protein